jgi:hypothetical protein
LSEYCEETQAFNVHTSNGEKNVLEEWRKGWIGNKSPVEVLRVREELEFVAMKAVAAIRKEMKDRDGGGNSEEDPEINPGMARS